MGLAAASALVVLIASGAVVSRLSSDDGPRRHSEAAPPLGAPGSAADSGIPDPGTPEPGIPESGTGSGESATSSGSVRVPLPVPAGTPVAGSAPAGPRAAGAAPVTGNPVPGGWAGTGPAGGVSAGSPEGASGGGPEGGSTGAPEPGPEAGDGSPEEGPEPERRDPESTALLAASVSAGEGSGGAVAGVALGGQPGVDVTVGTTPLVGDAPPSDGTGVGIGGTLLQPPPTVPTPPG